MNLAVVNEAVTGMNGVEHEFTEEEKNFVVQFAFRSGSKEDTISLIEALAHSTDKVQSEEIMVTYRSKYDIKLYDEQNRVVTTKKGDELYTHYDKVESSVRERYEKVQKEQKKTTKKKTVTTRKER